MGIIIRRKYLLTGLVLLLSACLPISAIAQKTSEQTSQKRVLQRLIDEQQMQLDRQQKQLDKQKKNLRVVQQQLHRLSGEDDKSLVSSTSNITPRRNDLQTNRRDDTQSHDDWGGSFTIKDADTRIKIGGFIELDVIHDTDAIQSKGQFIPSTIVTRNATKKDGADGQTNFSVSPSRLFIETRTPVDQKRIKTFLSLDMYADELGVEPEVRMRQAYIEVSNTLFGGSLLIGQAWSTTADLESAPDVLDFRGTDNMFGALVPQIRWTKEVSEGIKVMLAAETASNHIIEGADSLTRFPDGVFAVTWDSHIFNLMISVLVTDVRASFNNGPIQSAIGYGGSFSGKIKLPFGSHQNDLLFSLTSGLGVGSHYQNSHADAVYDTSNASLELLENFGVTVAYVHGWNSQLKSTFTYCCIEIYNHDAQALESLQSTEYSSANLVWDINTHWMIGAEALWGKRKDRDNIRGSNFRTQLTSRLSF